MPDNLSTSHTTLSQILDSPDPVATLGHLARDLALHLGASEIEAQVTGDEVERTVRIAAESMPPASSAETEPGEHWPRGPWLCQWSERAYCWTVLRAQRCRPRERLVCVVTARGARTQPQEHAAARLIAMAPSLYEGTVSALALLQAGSHGSREQAARTLKTLAMKARGEPGEPKLI